MKKYISLIGLSLLICLFIYLFYRTDKTLVNRIFISLFSQRVYDGFKTSISQVLPLSSPVVYSLPEGLWVFCITITSMFFYVSVGKWRISLAWIPLLLAVGLEICQLFSITNGRFDMVDIGISCLFWLVAYVFTDTDGKEEDIRTKITLSSVSCIFCYCIVYLAHVIR